MSTADYIMVPVPVRVVHSLYMTGWFGRPGMEGGKVHVVHKSNRVPLCGQVQHPDSEFQWCAMRIEPRYIECEKCKVAAAKIVLGRAA